MKSRRPISTNSYLSSNGRNLQRLHSIFASWATIPSPFDQAAKGQTVAGKPLAVKHLPVAAPDAGCQVMYLSGTDAQTIAQGLAAMKGAPVLTVTDEATHPNDHGIISFVIDANHVRFDIDDAAAAQSGLVISSKLLGLAHSVKPRSPGAHGG
jgi:hypothetical protein